MASSETHNTVHFAESLIAAVRNAAIEKQRPDGTTYRSLFFKEEKALCTAYGVSHKDVQLAALANDIVPERYSRNQKTLSNEQQTLLLNSHVAIIGLGGLGGTVTEILARIGVGKLTLVDGDHFEDSNLNRQLLSSSDLLDQMKADVADERVQALNPAVETIAIKDFFTQENSAEILTGVNIAVDCLDTIADRFLLEDGCRQKSIPLVSAAIGGASGQATVIFPEDAGLRMVYGSQKRSQKKGVEASLGTLPYAAMALAAIECAEVVGLAIGNPAQLRKKLMLADFRYHTMDTVEFE